MSAADPPDAAQPGPTRWWWWLILLAAVAAPVVSAGWSREHQRWYPEGDDATIVLLSHDTFSAHPPQLGMISTGGAGLDDPELHHPGPLELYLLAPFVHLGDQPVPGVTIATVLVNVAALAGLGLALRRLGGDGLAAAGLVMAGLAVWGLGGDVPASVWNPFIVAIPFAAFLALAVATTAGRRELLPWTLGVGSFVMQTHLSYVGMVGLICAWTIGVVAWGAVRRPDERSGIGRLAARSAAVVAVLWAVPLGQQVTGQPGNLSQIVRSALGPGGDIAGATALGELGRVVGVPLLGWRPRPDIVRVLPPLDAGSAIALLVPALLIVGLWLRARRRGDATILRALATVAVVLLAASITATRIPLSDGVLYQYYALWMWPVGVLTWLVIGWGALRLGWTASGTEPDRDRLPVSLAVVAGVVLAAAVLVSALPRPGAWAPWAAYRRIAGQTVPDAVSALPGSGRVVVHFRGGTAYLSTGSAVVLGAEVAGHHAEVDPGVPTEVFPWTERRRVSGDDPAAALWVVSGADPSDLPADARLVVEVPTLTRAERTEFERTQAVLRADLDRHGLRLGPREPETAADRALLATAQRDPLAALEQGSVARLAAKGLVQPPGGDLHRVFTQARMAALADERTVRVYVTR